MSGLLNRDKYPKYPPLKPIGHNLGAEGEIFKSSIRRGDLHAPLLFLLSSGLAACGGGGTTTDSADTSLPVPSDDEVVPPSDSLVDDLGELPSSNLAPSNISVATDFDQGATNIGQVTFSDESPDTVQLAVSGSDAQFFTILSDNTLIISQEGSDGEQQFFSITITATDDNQNETSKFFEITKNLDVQQQERVLEITLQETVGNTLKFGVFINEEIFNDLISGVEFAISFDPDVVSFAGTVNANNSISSGTSVNFLLNQLNVQSLVDEIGNDGEKDTFVVSILRSSDIQIDFENSPIFTFDMSVNAQASSVAFFTPTTGAYDTVSIASTAAGNQTYNVDDFTYSIIV